MNPVRTGVGIVVAVVVFIAALIVVSGATFVSTDSSKGVCVFQGGPFDGRAFKELVAPGSGRKYVGQLQTTTTIPTGVRQYRVSRDPNQGDTPGPDSVSVSVQGIGMQFEPTITFTLATYTPEGDKRIPLACDLVQRQLRQFDATDFDKQGGNWQFRFLNERVRPVINDVTTRVLGQKDPVKVRYNVDGERDKAATEIGAGLTKAIETALGARYFCGPTYQFGQGVDQCGDLRVTLPEPIGLSDQDANTLAGPQRAKTEANAAVAAETENTRKALVLAEQREAQVAAAQRQGAADVAIKGAQNVTAAKDAEIKAAYCAALTRLGQNCALVIAAESGKFPTVIGASSITAQVPPQ